MKIRMLTGQAGLDFTRDIGKEYDVEAEEAKRLIESGQAEPVKSQKVEKTTIRKPKKK